MSSPSPFAARGLGPPPSLDGLSQLLSEANGNPRASAPPAPSSSMPPPSSTARVKSVHPINTASANSFSAANNGTDTTNGAAYTPTSSSILSPNHPYNLRKQAKTHLDASFSVKSYIGAANALLEKARSSDAQGQPEQAFVNYLKAADVAANIPKHADWQKTLEQRGPTYFRYQDFMKNVPDIIQRGHRLEELLQAREESRAQEAKNALQEQQQESKIFVETEPEEGAVGGTDAITDQTAAQMDSLASRLGALRANGGADNVEARKRMTLPGSAAMGYTPSMDGATSSQPQSASNSPNHMPTSVRTGLPSPRLEKSGFIGLNDGQPVGPDMQPTYIPTQSEFNKSYPTLDDFESQHPRPDTPSRPLPVPPSQAGRPSKTSVSIPPKREISVEDLFPLLYPGYDNVNDPKTGQTRVVKRQGPRILVIDIRSRRDWERSRMKGADSINVDPSNVQSVMTLEAIGAQLATAPEQHAFAERNAYDIWLLCDRDGRGASNGLIDRVYKGLMEDGSRSAPDQIPMVLVGGVERWSRKIGEGGMQGESGIDAGRGKSGEAPTSDAVNGDGRSKRQAMYISTPPPSLIPGHMAGSQASMNGRSGVNGMSYGSGMDMGDSLSMPARAYQSGGNTASHTGLQSSSIHAKQPHIPLYANNANMSSPPVRQSTGTFDYPQLNAQLQKRPMFNNASLHAPPLPPPAPTAASSGLGMRSPSLESAGRMSMDLSRRPPIPSPYSGPPMSSAAAATRLHHSATGNSVPRSKRMEDNIRIGMTGLKNVGNSCYMNSTLQCLSATIPLSRFLLDGSYKKAINRVNPLGTQGALAEAFAQLIRVMWSENYTFVSPVTFREAITRYAPAFRGCDQHDAQEFLAFLLDGLHEDLNYVKQKPPPVEMTPEREHELEILPQQIASVKEWQIYRERNESLIVDWFQGQFRNKLTCLTCGKTSTTYNAFLYLSLPIPPTARGMGNKVTLAQCLDAFTKDEILDKADAWHCPRCNKPRKATKKLTISRLPQVLLIHLKRFSFKGPFTDKIETNVSFPTSNLDLTNYMPPPLPPGAVPKGMPISSSQQPPYVYDLYAATHHFGSLSGGHYTATVRAQDEKGQPVWKYCDDSRITTADDRQIHSPSTYILWWHRKGR
ncbi:cysteine proteinase [Meira miltonrushii]|uniref:ubiquitinyl hydrolase 1 n=1 Tax=Meira miltonrushii TaxID=1280837 RepID=A0A316V332_9BASI|nr:cysteine proteinase [Meira miltonrushii]PWN31967.1 cysteine proteinase [Meira miltonrushii]